MRLIIWNPISRVGKEEIKIHGSTWQVITEDMKRYFVVSLTYSKEGSKPEKEFRWLNKGECSEFKA